MVSTKKLMEIIQNATYILLPDSQKQQICIKVSNYTKKLKTAFGVEGSRSPWKREIFSACKRYAVQAFFVDFYEKKNLKPQFWELIEAHIFFTTERSRGRPTSPFRVQGGWGLKPLPLSFGSLNTRDCVWQRPHETPQKKKR